MDIDYYKRQLKKYNSREVLVVGAGTGRVAIPLSKESNVEVLDIDEYRLDELHSKQHEIKCHKMDVCKETPKKEYDTIIIPYSTIQLLGSDLNIIRALSNCSHILTKNGILIFDVSESFNTKPNTKRGILFEDYCSTLETKISVYYQSQRYMKYMKFITEFYLHSDNVTLAEIEQYRYYDKKKLESLVNFSMTIDHVDEGYKDGMFVHKHLYHCRKR
jgi:ubiquinone/menaquinone biosynthesis C-methylase UbiE